jgi:hypothetical protein
MPLIFFRGHLFAWYKFGRSVGLGDPLNHSSGAQAPLPLLSRSNPLRSQSPELNSSSAIGGTTARDHIAQLQDQRVRFLDFLNSSRQWKDAHANQNQKGAWSGVSGAEPRGQADNTRASPSANAQHVGGPALSPALQLHPVSPNYGIKPALKTLCLVEPHSPLRL